MDSIEILPDVLVTQERCLYLRREKAIVLGDLHLGYEKALEEEGMYIPRINTQSIRDELNNILFKYEPEKVVLLGDVKHDFRRTRFESRDEVRRIVDLLRKAAQVVVVKGNHDNFLQNVLYDTGIIALDHIDLGGFRMEHGHEDSGKRPVIIGHEHPSVRIRGEMAGSLKLQCFLHLKKEGIIVIPPFSPLSMGSDLSLSDPGSFMSPHCKASDTGDADVYAISELGMLPLGRLGDIDGIALRTGLSVFGSCQRPIQLDVQHR